MRIVGRHIFIERGDVESILVFCTNVNDEPEPFEVGDAIYFTVKCTVFDTQHVIQKIITDFDEGKALILINHDDTKDLPFGQYVYDIRWYKEGDKPLTIIPYSHFNVKEVVTNE